MAIDSIQNVTTKLEFWLLQIADLPNNYNPLHQIIRVSFGENYYDLKCNPGFYVPNRNDHLVVAMLSEGFFENASQNPPISEDQEDLPPGLLTREGTLSNVPEGLSWIVPKRQTVCTTAPQNANAGFSISGTNMFERENVLVAISPHLIDKDYTTLKEKTEIDNDYQSIGLFINRQGSVLLKSTGGSITLGKEGVHIGGKLMTSSSNKDTGVMTENPLSKILGSTIPTAAASWPTIPNIGTIAAIANAGAKFVSIMDAAKSITNIIKNVS